jgi:CDP-glycerol glycerophosphotransferase (TagB/SpsB family)
LSEDYGYDKNVVKLTGMPRYDSLYDNNQRKIFFAPTWRFSIDKDKLQKSEYCKKISRFLSDKNFIKKLKEHGYGLMFKPHPMFADIVSYFKADEYVEIIPYNVSYQTLFAESSLLITDFSSTAFDFAYLKKPVIYYHFFENHMGKSYFDYETMGFGEVTADYDKLIDMVIEYIDNDCVMKDEYKQRVNEFFAYFDKNNTRRVYDEVINI